jgi:hypothetical protein
VENLGDADEEEMNSTLTPLLLVFISLRFSLLTSFPFPFPFFNSAQVLRFVFAFSLPDSVSPTPFSFARGIPPRMGGDEKAPRAPENPARTNAPKAIGIADQILP